MNWLHHPLVVGLICFNFMFGFFFALSCLMVFWQKEVRQAVLETDEKPDLIRPFMNQPIFMFVSVWIMGLPVFLILIYEMMKDLRA